MRKGIILSGGMGTRLYPCTEVTSKQLLPVYDKPLIYYPLSILMLAGIKDIMIITTVKDSDQFQRLLKDGSQYGLSITYETQQEPRGIAEAFRIARDWIGEQSVALILGDNIFYGNDLTNRLLDGQRNNGCTVFACHVTDPGRFGVLTFDSNDNLIEIIEKPKQPNSNFAVTGLYFFDNKVIDYSYAITPSQRNELEIADIINLYIKNNNCKVEFLNRGVAWFDTGTVESLLEASVFVGSIQKRTGTMIACPEEIAYRNSWITGQQLSEAAKKYGKSDYGKYLEKIQR
jgi:glucose-1-phosphate thymidylyltransferase